MRSCCSPHPLTSQPHSQHMQPSLLACTLESTHNAPQSACCAARRHHCQQEDAVVVMCPVVAMCPPHGTPKGGHATAASEPPQGAVAAVAGSKSSKDAAQQEQGGDTLDLISASPDLLGMCRGPGCAYDVGTSGPPLPPCEDERCVGGWSARGGWGWHAGLGCHASTCQPPPCSHTTPTYRLRLSHLGELLEAAPREELQNILSLVCRMFGVKNALGARVCASEQQRGTRLSWCCLPHSTTLPVAARTSPVLLCCTAGLVCCCSVPLL
jgi:hypothetical protein